MTSLSDSQNIDLDRPSDDGQHSHTVLPPGSPLQACPHCDALIDITEREPLEVISCPGCSQQFAINGQVGPYQIIEAAGRGGMGVVYKAYDPSLDREIALKLLRKDHSEDARLIQQLEAEAAITASINDPNVVKVYGTGRDRGRFYLAMELVDKGSLDELINLQGRVAEMQVLQVGVQIATGLRAAWQHGLIHRDVKPGNILFADAQTAKIVDFGLAIFMDQEESVRGEIWGTPYYVAPEKLDQEPEDFRSDMYSLGGTLFHALAGRPPFEAENASLVALKHLKSQAVSLKAFAPWVSNATSHIINRTLSKNPGARYQSYDELIQNFEYALEELQTKGAAPQGRTRVVLETDEDQKNWTWVVLGMAAVMVILVGVFFFMLPKNRSKDSVASTTTASTSNKATGKIASLEKQLNALTERDPKAASMFAQVLADGKLGPSDQTWAAFLQATAELVAQRPAEAQAAFGKVEAIAAPIKDEAVGKFLIATANRLTKPEPIPESETSSVNSQNHELIAIFAYGLHNWAAGQPDEGVSLLRQFRSGQPNGSYSWLNSFKPLVSSYVGDLTQFNTASDRLKNAKNAGERADAASSLRAYTGGLATKANAAIQPFAKEIDEYIAKINQPPAGGVYIIVNKKSSKSLDLSGFNRGNNADVMQYGLLRQSNQNWELIPNSDGSFQIRALCGRSVLDVANSTQDEGGRVQMYEPNLSDAQRFKIESAGNAYFRIRSKVSSKLVCIRDQSTDDGALIEQRTDAGDSSLWRFERVGNSLPDGWSAVTVGNAKSENRVTCENGTFTIANRGRDIWDRNDECTFVIRGDQFNFDLVGRVVSVDRTDQWAKAGFMVRSNLQSNDANFALFITPDNTITRQTRPRGGEITTSEHTLNVPLPRWLKLERRGNKFISYHSPDGQNWTQIGENTVPDVRREGIAGLALTSHNDGKTTTAKIDKVTFTGR